MRRVLFCAVLLLSLPAAATISQVQSKATWAATGSNCQVIFTSFPTQGNMIAVWTSWTTSGTNNVSVVSVKDSLGNGKGNPATFPSAVGPTLQSASNTAAQISYAPITIGGGADTVTVAFSSAPSSSNCVIVEYSGADQNYPLDSVSAGYSTSGNPTSLLDSGNAAPANSNLLVFAGGTIDTSGGTAVAGNNFTAIQSHGGSITEQNTSVISGNNVLQRATAGLLASGTGNWLMQMAVFRDASWTVAGGWNPARPSKIEYADQFPGATADAQINAAIASLNGNGGIVDARGVASGFVSTTIAIPPNTIVELNPNAVYTCTVASAPCFLLSGRGAKLLGSSMGGVIGTYNPSVQTGTIIRADPGTITRTTDLVSIQTSSTTSGSSFSNGGFEVGNLILDFNQSNPATYTGDDCIVGYSFSHSTIHDIECLNPGSNGLEFLTATNGLLYNNLVQNVFVQAAGNDGFKWSTVSNSGGRDMDRWTCEFCIYSPATSSGKYSGVNGFEVTTGIVAGQAIQDFMFRNIWVGGLGTSGANAGIFLNQQGTTSANPAITNVWIFGEVENQNGVGNGTGMMINNAGLQAAVQRIYYYPVNDDIAGEWAFRNNFGSAKFQSLTYGYGSTVLQQIKSGDFAGSCTLHSGSCQFNIRVGYNLTPLCPAFKVSGTVTGVLSAAVSSSTMTISDTVPSDTGVAGAFCIGNPN